MIVVGYGTLGLMAGTYSVEGVVKSATSLFPITLVPVLFIAVGLYVIVRSVFFSNREDKMRYW